MKLYMIKDSVLTSVSVIDLFIEHYPKSLLSLTSGSVSQKITP